MPKAKKKMGAKKLTGVKTLSAKQAPRKAALKHALRGVAN